MRVSRLLLFVSCLPLFLGAAGYCILDGEDVANRVPGYGGAGGAGAGSVETIQAGTSILVDDTDPSNPVVSATIVAEADPTVSWTGTHDFNLGFGNSAVFDDQGFYLETLPLGTGFKAGFTGTASFTSDHTFELPYQSGTLAMTDDIPVLVPLWELAGGIGSFAAVERGTGSISGSADFSTNFGLNNTIGSSNYSHILSGGHATSPNSLGTASYCVIFGGWDNKIFSANSACVVGGGSGNQLNTSVGAWSSYILGGKDNRIQTGACRSTIVVGGQGNILTGADNNGGILSGQDNTVTSSLGGTILGGFNNNVGGLADYSGVAGGKDNTINGATYSSITGGELNTGPSSGFGYSSVLGGRNNTASASFCTVAGNTSVAGASGAAVFSDSRAGATNDGGDHSFTFNFEEGLDLVVVTTAPDAPAAGRVTYYCLRSGTGPNYTYAFTAKYSDGTTDVISTHTVP